MLVKILKKMKNNYLISLCLSLLLVFFCPLSVSAQDDIDVNAMIQERLQELMERRHNASSSKQRPKDPKKKRTGVLSLDEFADFPFLGNLEVASVNDFKDVLNFKGWGDPVANPRIRRDRANHLYGYVRHNKDGSRRFHQGFDYFAPVGTPVLAIGPGTVIRVQTHKDYGNCILIEHLIGKDVVYAFYAHLSSVSSEVGDEVRRGTIIGKSGTTGNAAGLKGEDEHVHFEIRINPNHMHGGKESPNEVVRTKFYSADSTQVDQSQVGVIKRYKK